MAAHALYSNQLMQNGLSFYNIIVSVILSYISDSHFLRYQLGMRMRLAIVLIIKDSSVWPRKEWVAIG